MCRIQECFDVDRIEHEATDKLAQLRAERNEVKVRIYTAQLHRLDPRIMDWQPITDKMTGAELPDYIKRQRIYTTEKALTTTLRQWARKTKPDELGHSEAARALWLSGMIVELPLTQRQRAVRGKAWKVNKHYAISLMGLDYLAWLEARAEDEYAARDALWREHNDYRVLQPAGMAI